VADVFITCRTKQKIPDREGQALPQQRDVYLSAF